MTEMPNYSPATLPVLHPDKEINSELLIEALCNKLNTARQGCLHALEMNVVTPAAVAMKNNVRYALKESAPESLLD